MKTIIRNLTIAAGGGTHTLKGTGLVNAILVTGSDVSLTSGLTIATDTAEIGLIYNIYWKQKVTKGTGSFTILGNTIDKLVIEECLIRAIYNGSTWDVWVVDNLNFTALQSHPTTEANWVQTSDGSGGFLNGGATLSAAEGFILGHTNTAVVASFIFGHNNVISGASSAFIFGTDNSIGGGFVLGDDNTNTGLAQIISGHDNSCVADYVHIFGDDNIANSYKETIIGHFGLDTAGSPSSWVATDLLFSIGNGSATSSRSNAFEVLKNGNSTFKDNLRVDGVFSKPLKIITVNSLSYSLNEADNYDEIILHVTYTSTGACTITLDTDMLVLDTKIVIKDTGNASLNNITIATEGSATIDGAATHVISNDYDSITLYPASSNWFII